MLHRHCLIVTLVVAFSCSVRADVIFVDVANCPGPGDGSELDPYCSIQTAIDNAVDADEIVVAPGTYFETINFLGKAITLRSSDGPAVTAIDAGGTGPVVLCLGGEGPDTVLDGFAITGGMGSSGGGMINEASSPTVTNCVFVGNTAVVHGGGMANLFWSNPSVIDCTFTENAGLGGGMFNFVSSPTVIDSAFNGNVGGGMINEVSNPVVTGCSFTGNTSGHGAGMFNGSSSSPTVTNCSFSRNSASLVGGGMYNFTADSVLVNCTFSGNLSKAEGGAMWSFNSMPTLVNCTFSSNAAGTTGGGMYNLAGSQIVTNSIFWGNGPDQIFDDIVPVTTVSFSNVQGGWPGTGNIDADPLFVDPNNGDYRLSSGSPCIDAGNNWGVPPDTADVDGDGDTRELTPWDLDGNPRFNADPADFDPGCGVPVVVDMGAYEFQFDPVDEVFLGDIDGDGIVGIVDFLALLANWGPCEPGCCLADLDIDGDVGITDFLLLLASWGR